MPKPTHIVCKPFDAGKRHLKTGEKVDATTWRNTPNLVKSRYLVPLVDEVSGPQIDRGGEK